MSSKITTPYPLFNDVDGRPLDAGFVYIGEAGKNPEIYPTPVFWDENLTVPAEQPVRTRNGYFSKNGRAGKLYVADADCSITAKNKNKIVVHTDLFADLFFGQKDVVKTVETIANLNNIVPWDGRTVYVKGYYEATNFALAQPYKGGGTRIYVASRSNENDGFLCINGWVLQVENSTVSPSHAGGKNDTSFDSSDAVQKALLYTGETLIDDYYYIKKSVWFPVSKVITGIGMWSCGLVKNGDGVLDLVHDKSTGRTVLDKNAVLVGYADRFNTSYSEDCYLSDFSLRYSGSLSNSIGLYVPVACRSMYKNILIENCDVGYQTSDSWLMTLNMVHVRNSRIAFYNGSADGTLVVNGTSNSYIGTYAEVCSGTAYIFNTYQYSAMTVCAADKMPATARSVFEIYNTDIVITSQGCEQINTKLFEINYGANVNLIGGQLILDNNFKQSNSWSNALINLRGVSKLVSNNTKFVISSDAGTDIAGLASVNESSVLEINDPAMYQGLIGSVLDNNSFNSFSSLDVKIWNGSVAKIKTPYGGIERRSLRDLPPVRVGFKNPNLELNTYISTKTTGFSVSRAFNLQNAYNLNNLLDEGFTGVFGQSFWNGASTSLNYPRNNEAALIHQMRVDRQIDENGNPVSGSVPYSAQMCFSGTDISWRVKIDQNPISTWGRILTSRNTSTDSNGFIKAASPICHLYADRIELNDEASEQPISYEKLGTGDYLVKGSLGFAQEGWYIEMPKDANGNVLVAVVYEQLSNNDISVKTYAKKFDEETGDVVPNLSKPRDIPESRWITLRLQELPKPEQEIEPVN